MRKTGLFVLVLLAACSEGDASGNGAVGNATGAAPSGDLLETPAGRYKAEIDPALDRVTLPTNADFKMLGGDLPKYAAQLCGLEYASGAAVTRCEVFVQKDKAGLLTGYVALQQGGDASIQTDVETDKQRSGTGCFIEGKLENADYDNLDAKVDASKDFESRIPFYGWEKDPGNWMVSFNESGGDEFSAGGMWYVTRQGSRVRISQERWNYCYRDRDVNVDEVFEKAVSLTRVST